MSCAKRVVAAALMLLVAACAQPPTSAERLSVLLSEAPRVIVVKADADLPEPGLYYRGERIPPQDNRNALLPADEPRSLLYLPLALLVPIAMMKGAPVPLQGPAIESVHHAPVARAHGLPELCAEGIVPAEMAARLSEASLEAARGGRHLLRSPAATSAAPADGELSLYVRSIAFRAESERSLAHHDPYLTLEIRMDAMLDLNVKHAGDVRSRTYKSGAHRVSAWRKNRAARLRAELAQAAAELAADAVSMLDAPADLRAMVNVERERTRQQEQLREAATAARFLLPDGAVQPPFRGEHMNWDRIAGNWKQAQGKIKEQWGKLTDDDLDKIAGKRDQLAGKIQNTYGIGKDEAEKQIKDWEAQNKDWSQ